MRRTHLLLALPAAAAATLALSHGWLGVGLVCAGVTGICVAVHFGRARAEEHRWRHRFWTGLRAAVTESDLSYERSHAALRTDDL